MHGNSCKEKRSVKSDREGFRRKQSPLEGNEVENQRKVCRVNRMT